ncbi:MULTISPECIES: DUF2690 domain-containing protein [Streptomyces]|uniref:DUF2690 domain-containing protein n=1 Tax=Streptomyces TaxID=1883 RepID=UPI00068A1EDF|nr:MULTISPECIES: DUF2690 domain-containing protein [Streptomyces]MBP2346314.1 hypothetical protein [Streptomyces virginiae]MCI4083552.1 YjfA family protein [Streptomyces sp. MMS21 TC-5]MEC4573384.1 DUF2690 domain-containing protein [Streptomyces sp. CMAA1738]GGQ34138.1 hypothetical protein GCM10010215_67600 [Streptomyces virginiae]GLV94229.1 hypothetical protein Slala04_56830 [Streptomyces lavendulae subsp. lavendulae]
MSIIARKLATTGSVLALAASGLLFASTPASAATSCLGSTCTGKDPATTTCQNDAKTVYWDGWFNVELRYSPSCRAAWARWQGAGGATEPLKVQIENNQGATYSVTTTGATVYTRMVNDKDVLARAAGFKNGGAQYSYTAWY